ncbi:MAG: carboxypeptidase regulatory-like domain-containing protein [Caldilineaceae bacterium]|nr:carboxypeptidase regulatory-like domain-containing protein [Caldilineaceae bacterium]
MSQSVSMRCRLFFLLSFCTLSLTSGLWLLLHSPHAVTAAPEVPGALSGIIRGSTGLPLVGIKVRLYRNNSLNNIIQTATTNETGLYRFTMLSAGLYRLRVEDPSLQYPSPQYYPNAIDLQDAADILVTGGAAAQADMQLQTGGRLRGRVTTMDGTPLGQIEVSVYSTRNPSIAITQTATNAAGLYEVQGLASGYYYLHYHDQGRRHYDSYYGNASSIYKAIPIGVSAGGVAEQLNITLVRGHTIQGTVRGLDGQGAAGIVVTARPYSNYSSKQTATTDAQGRYVVGPLLSDFYLVRFEDPTEYYALAFYDNPDLLAPDGRSIAVQGDRTGIDRALIPLGVVQGQVTNDLGAPLADIVVTAYPQAYVGGPRTTFTSADGTYSLHGLVFDNYRIEFTNPTGIYLREYYSNTTVITHATVITPFPTIVITNINASLTAGGAITGSVVLSDPDPFAGPLLVQAIQLDDPSTPIAASVWLDMLSQTSYTLGGLAPGMYAVRIRSFVSSEYYTNATTLQGATPVQVVAGQMTRDINFVLGDQVDTVTISGAVRTSTGQPLANVAVRAYCDGCWSMPLTEAMAAVEWPGVLASGGTTPWQPFRTVATNAAGHYQLSGLYPGRYRLRFAPYRSLANTGTDGNYAFVYYQNALDLASAQDVTLAPYQQLTNIDATLMAGAVLTGLVTFADGTPPTEGQVRLYFWNGYGWEAINAASLYGRNGAYQFATLQSGRYRVEVEGFLGKEPFRYYYANSTTLTNATEVAITAGLTTTDININIPTAIFFNAEITGTVTANRQPVAGIRVELYEFGSEHPLFYTTTDSAGRYALANLPRGNYFVGFHDPSGRYAMRYNGGTTNYSIAYFLSLFYLESNTVVPNINADLQPGGGIRGRILDLNGRGIDQLLVQAWVWEGQFQEWVRAAPRVKTAADGSYHVAGLGADVYRLSVEDPLGRYGDLYYGGVQLLSQATDVTVVAAVTTPLADWYLMQRYVSFTDRFYLPLIVR